MIVHVELDNHNQFYSLNSRKKPQLEVLRDKNTSLNIIKTKMFGEMLSTKVGIEIFHRLLFWFFS